MDSVYAYIVIYSNKSAVDMLVQNLKIRMTMLHREGEEDLQTPTTPFSKAVLKQLDQQK